VGRTPDNRYSIDRFRFSLTINQACISTTKISEEPRFGEGCRAFMGMICFFGLHPGPCRSSMLLEALRRRLTHGELRSLFHGRWRHAGTPVRGAASGSDPCVLDARIAPTSQPSPANGQHRRLPTPPAGGLFGGERERGPRTSVYRQALITLIHTLDVFFIFRLTVQ